MQLKIIAFGQISDIIGSSDILVNDILDTDALVRQLHTSYPALSHTRYAIAVNKKIIKENTTLTESSTVALLPPFSGG